MWRKIPTGILVLVLAACAGASPLRSPLTSSSPDLGPSADRSPTGSPGSTPVTSAAPTRPGGLAQDRVASVVTNDLVVRSLPEISAASIIDPVRLSDGQLLFVMDGPVAADGFDWFHVMAFEEHADDTPEELPGPGWVAAGQAGEPWIAAWPGACPASNLEDFWQVPSLLLLACFGGNDLVLEGTLHQCSYSVPGYISPAWLVHVSCEIRPDMPSDAFSLRPGFQVHQEEADVPAHDLEGHWVRVTGHFDDPAARTCVEDWSPLGEPTPPAQLILGCRAAFVATDITRLERP